MSSSRPSFPKSIAAFAKLSATAIMLLFTLPVSQAHAVGTNTAEDNFQRSNMQGWGTTTNNDGLPNYGWQRSLATNQPYSQIQSDNGIITYTGTNGHKCAGYVAVPASLGGDVLEEVSFSAVGHQLAGLMLQVTGGSYWYQADINTHTNLINLVKRNAGVMNWVASVPFTAQANTAYWVRLDVQPNGTGEILNTRVWAAGTPEPTSWMVTWTDSSPLAAGQTGAMGDWPTTPQPGEEIHYLNWSYSASGLAVPAN
jgi:hypothetical protein